MMLERFILSRFTRTMTTALLVGTWSGCNQNPLPPTIASPSPAPTVSASTLPATPSPTSPPPSTPTPVSTMTPLGVHGIVLDHDTGRPLAQAVIVISHEMYAGAAPPVRIPDGFVASTSSDGRFALSGVAPGTYPVEVYAPGHIAIHQELTIEHTDEELPAFRTSRLTVEEQNWLNQLNRDRAGWGAPPLVADEAVVEAARLRATTMANNGIFSHDCLPAEKHCLRGPDAELANGAMQAGGENIGAQNEGTWRDVESGMLAEWARCSPAARKPHSDGCSFSEETGHFLNMVNRTYHFVGVAAFHHGRSFDVSYGPSTDYYAMEFE